MNTDSMHFTKPLRGLLDLLLRLFIHFTLRLRPLGTL